MKAGEESPGTNVKATVGLYYSMKDGMTWHDTYTTFGYDHSDRPEKKNRDSFCHPLDDRRTSKEKRRPKKGINGILLVGPLA